MTGGHGHVYFDSPGVATVSWDEHLQAVVVEWIGAATSAEFHGVLDAEVRALQIHGAARLLADCRRQREIDPADLERGDREWVPRAAAAGLKRFAVVLPSRRLAAIDLEDRLANVPHGMFEVGYFNTIEQATRWLAQPMA